MRSCPGLGKPVLTLETNLLFTTSVTIADGGIASYRGYSSSGRQKRLQPAAGGMDFAGPPGRRGMLPSLAATEGKRLDPAEAIRRYLTIE
jgi:hypothetical protein